MEKLHVLGTGYALATRCYNTCFAVQNENGLFLIDAGGGNGILRQMEDAGLSFGDVHDFFITHAHPDHVNGAVWVFRKIMTMMRQGKYAGDLNVYCHASVREGLLAICRMMLQEKHTSLIGERVFFHDVEDRMKARICGREVTFFDIHSTKLLQFGFAMELDGGKRLACLGDEPFNPACRPFAEHADWLLSEAFCLYAHREKFKPYEKHHSTAADAAKLAEELSVKNLVLWHTEDQHLDVRKTLYAREAETYFQGRVFVPDDLDVIEL